MKEYPYSSHSLDCSRIPPIYLQAKQRVDEFLFTHDTDVRHVKTLNVDDRCKYLIDILLKDGSASCTERGIGEIKVGDSIGMLLIKPEIMPEENKITEYMQNKGFEVKVLDRVYPSRDEWMRIYGYMIDDYPDVINNYIMQRSLGVRPVLFKHLDNDQYIASLRNAGYSKDMPTDPDTLFDKLFCGNVNDFQPNTLRGDVSFPVMKNLGFDGMSGYASLFDPVNYFNDTKMTSNYRAYNGVHVPSDTKEKQSNINAIL